MAVKRYTDFPNGLKGFPRSGNTQTETATHTLTAAECVTGKTILHDASTALVVTLPILTGVVGGLVTIVNMNAGQLLTIDPNAADGIAFGNQIADGVTIVNTAATAKKGDYVTLYTSGSLTTGVANYWNVAEVGGIWAVGA